jgi:hypothetical protein
MKVNFAFSSTESVGYSMYIIICAIFFRPPFENRVLLSATIYGKYVDQLFSCRLCFHYGKLEVSKLRKKSCANVGSDNNTTKLRIERESNTAEKHEPNFEVSSECPSSLNPSSIYTESFSEIISDSKSYFPAFYRPPLYPLSYQA